MWITLSLPATVSSDLDALLLLPIFTEASLDLSVSLDSWSSARQVVFDSRDKNCSPPSTLEQFVPMSSVFMFDVIASGLQFDSESGRSSQANGCTSPSTSCLAEFVRLTSSK